MGGWRRACWIAAIAIALSGCEEPEQRLERLEITSVDRSCEDGDACGVVETSCLSKGCECGVAVNEASLIHYQRKLAECRGQEKLAVCDFACETPFGRCFKGACVLTSEPPDLFRRGRSLQALCEASRGTYVGCPECAPNERCESCLPCECPSSHRWTKKGCRSVVQTEARDIRVEVRPASLSFEDKLKTRVHNDSKRKIWLKTICGTPFYRARKKEDAWEKGYEPFHAAKCRVGSVELRPGASRPFVVTNLAKFEDPSGGSASAGTYRFELTYTDENESFRYSAPVYSGEFDVVANRPRK